MIRNFLFHRVNPERDRLWDPMDVALFEKCISYISHHYQVRLLEDVALSDDIKSTDNIATLSFDDGYKDNIVYAVPILAKYNCKASFYIVTTCIDQNIPTWTYILEYIFKKTKVSQINLDFDFLPVGLQVIELPTEKIRLEYVKKLKPYLKKISHEERNQILKKITDTFADVNLPRIMMNWDDLSQLHRAGHYIGSHTLSHCMLGTMTDQAEIKSELLLSGQLIQKHLGYFPKTISYPVGSYNDTTIKLSREAGYSIGLAVKQKLYDPAHDSIFAVPRIELYNENWYKTKLRITNFIETIKKIIRVDADIDEDEDNFMDW
jgi:peptidoglycan/xylan/chitin deacetylase (PgdA/CDA1 family)